MAQRFIFPVSIYLTITQGFHLTGKIHRGLDFGWNSAVAGSRSQPIISAESGTVISAVDGYGNTPNNRIYGNYVIVQHGDGFYSVYGHLAKGLKVKRGDKVSKGQQLGNMGNSGYSFGNHLHFELRKGANDRAHVVNPMNYLMLENHNVIVSTQSLYYDQIKYRQTSIGTPVPRNDAVDQVEVLIEDLNVRTKPSIHGDSLGYATKGIYNIHDVGKAGDYTWYEIEPDKWIAFSEKWARYYPKRTAAQLYSVTFVVTEGDVKGLQEYGKTIGVTPTVTEIK
jgi:hypothetical protein